MKTHCMLAYTVYYWLYKTSDKWTENMDWSFKQPLIKHIHTMATTAELMDGLGDYSYHLYL